RPTRGAHLTFALQLDARAVLDARRNLHGVALRPALAAGALALRAGLLDHRSVAATARAGLRQREHPLALGDDTAPVAFRTDDRSGSRPRSRAAAFAARRRNVNGDLRLETAQRLLEGDVDRNLDVGA